MVKDLTGRDLNAAHALIDRLQLQPHPEGGYYRETFRDPASCQGRSLATAIYFLLTAGQVSHWHRVDAGEIWHWYQGAPLLLSISDGSLQNTQDQRLGVDFEAGEQPQIVVPAKHWQSARTLGAYTLVGCTVAPGFDFSGFELAAPDWQPE